MADKQDNDEYKFSDLDEMHSESMEEEPSFKPEKSEEELKSRERSDLIRRNVLIVIVVVIVAFLLYKFIGSYFIKKTTTTTPPIPQVTTPVAAPKPVEPPPKPAAAVEPVVTPPAPTPAPENPAVQQKLEALESNQESLRADLNKVNTQLDGINNSINALNTKMAELNQTITTLATTVEQQSTRITALLAPKLKPKKNRVITIQTKEEPLVYYIQAVIPGRAWLIASNGSTLTVREGTKVQGFGVVRLIDAIQGRVLMSTGRVIRFSQQDS
jgi:intracellular multiplication protein IcmG